MHVFSRFLLLVVLLLPACAPTTPANPTPAATATPPLTPTLTPTPMPSPTPPPTATPIGEAAARFVHAAPGVDAVTVYAGDTAVATNLDFGQATELTPLPAGSYSLRVVPAGSRSTTAPILEQALTFERDTVQLLVLADTGAVNFVVFPASVPPLSAGELGLRLVNLFSDVSEVFLSQTDSVLAAAAQVGLSDSIRLPADVTGLELRDSAGVILTLDDVGSAGIHRTLFLVGSRTQPAVVTVDDRAPGLTSLRVVNASTIAPAVDIYLNDQLLAANVEYIRPAERIETTTGTYAARVFAAGADPGSDQPLVSGAITLDNTSHSLLMVLGSAANPVVTAYPEDLSPTPPREARMTFINTLDQFPMIQLQTGQGTVIETRYGEVPSQTTFSDGSFNFYWLGIDRDGQENTAEIAENVQLEVGSSYLYFITGRVDNNPVILSNDVDTTDESAVNTDEAIPNDAARLRLVNALQDAAPVEFTADGASLGTVEYGLETDFVGLKQRGAEIGARVDGNELAVGSATFASGQRYTVVVYGAVAEEVRLLILSDDALVFSGDAPHLRLINASLDPEVHLGLAYSTAAPAIENAPEGTDEPTIDRYRRSIPFGTFTLVNDIAGRTDSGVILLSPGTVNLDVLDSNRTQLAVSLAFVDLQAGAFYDVIAYQETDTPRVRAFILLYPARSD